MRHRPQKLLLNHLAVVGNERKHLNFSFETNDQCGSVGVLYGGVQVAREPAEAANINYCLDGHRRRE